MLQFIGLVMAAGATKLSAGSIIYVVYDLRGMDRVDGRDIGHLHYVEETVRSV